MILTDKETTWLVMIIPLVISLGWGALLTWITIKAQHAKSIDEIKDETKKIFVRLFLWVSNLSAVIVLFLQFNSDATVSRRDVFLIVWSASIIILSLILEAIVYMREMARLQKEHLKLTKLMKELRKQENA